MDPKIYTGVPKLGTVEIGKHAIDRMKEKAITEEQIRAALYTPSRPDLEVEPGKFFREKGQIRLILSNRVISKAQYVIKTVVRASRTTKSLRPR
jgi:hypothetical protein